MRYAIGMCVPDATYWRMKKLGLTNHAKALRRLGIQPIKTMRLIKAADKQLRTCR